MVEKKDCSFCGSPVEPGTGLLYVKRDGTRYNFCSSKCRRNLLDLGRVPRTVKWTKYYIKGLGKAATVQTSKKEKKPVAAAATTAGTSEAAPAEPKPAKAPAAPKAKGEKKSASPKGGS